MYTSFSRGFRRLRGFTQIEVLIIVFIIGIVATMAMPSFADMLESIKMKQAVTELKSAFQESQRQSIRNNQPCSASLLIPIEMNQSVRVNGKCLASGDRTLPTGIGFTTNVIPDDSSVEAIAAKPSNPPIYLAGAINSVTCALKVQRCDLEDSHHHTAEQAKVNVGVGFGPSGAAQFHIAHSDLLGESLADTSAKFVAYREQKVNASKQCVVLSGNLGLTRIGRYEGGLTPEEITKQGRCTAVHWTQQ